MQTGRIDRQRLPTSETGDLAAHVSKALVPNYKERKLFLNAHHTLCTCSGCLHTQEFTSILNNSPALSDFSSQRLGSRRRLRYKDSSQEITSHHLRDPNGTLIMEPCLDQAMDRFHCTLTRFAGLGP